MKVLYEKDPFLCNLLLCMFPLDPGADDFQQRAEDSLFLTYHKGEVVGGQWSSFGACECFRI